MKIPEITTEQQESLDNMTDCTQEHRNTVINMYQGERIEKASPESFDRLKEVQSNIKRVSEAIEFDNAQQVVWRTGELIVALTRMVEEYNVAKGQMDMAGRYQAIRILTQQTGFN